MAASSSNEQIVVTGLGVVSGVGVGVPAFWDSLTAGRSGIARVTHFDPSNFRSQIGCEVKDFDAAKTIKAHPKADPQNPCHVAAPMPGRVVSISVEPDQRVAKGDVLLCIEAMKMEMSLRADAAGEVESIPALVGMQVDAHDLLVVLR